MTKSELSSIKSFAELMCHDFQIGMDSAQSLLEKSYLSGEISKITDEDIGIWYKERFAPNAFFIDEKDYLKVCVNALKIQFLIAGTDYGSSRQRDLGQKWSDTIRGYIGEFGFKKLLESRWDIKSELGHEEGALDDYLDLDIHGVQKKGDTCIRKPKINISIKTTKFNGIWLDIPGAQFEHSDVHIFAKIGVDTNHLFAFFKSISVFKDKILKCGTDHDCITQDEATDIYNKLPSFKPIVGYICGFATKNGNYKNLDYSGKKGKKNYKINKWHGPYEPSDIEKIKKLEEISGKIEFEGIGQFSNEKRYIFNTGSLFYSEKGEC